MATVTVDREVVTPQHAAFDAVADFTSSAVWDPGIASSRRLDAGPVTRGSRFEVRYRFGPLTLPLVYEITRYERPDRVVLETRSPLHVGEDDVRFRSSAAGTEVSWRARFAFRGPGILLEPVLRVAFPRVAQEAGDGLALHLGSLADPPSQRLDR
jgi:dehydrogenase/reductase SDR family member 12